MKKVLIWVGAVVGLIAVFEAFTTMSTWEPIAEGARPVLSEAEGTTPKFSDKVKVSRYKATQAPPDSQYIFSEVTPVYSIENRNDELDISVGLVGLPKEKRPRWFLSMRSESGLGDLVCHKGEKIWPRGQGEFDEEGFIGGCLGTGLGARFNKSADVQVVPFIGRGNDGWRIYVNDRHVGTFTYEPVDHTKERLLDHSRIRNAYGCIPLSEHSPSTLNCEN
jgi:hypothetical protein